jgi:tetratricopeptide (TPR) repeat protein
MSVQAAGYGLARTSINALARAATLLAALSALQPLSAQPLLGSKSWVRAKLGPFEAVSDDGRTPAIQALSQFEQFRFALGTAMGQPELRLDPPLRIIVFRDAKELAAQGCDGIHMGRDHLMACAAAGGQLPAPIVRELTRRLLETNFTGIPPATETALETFFSTVASNAVHVTWGAPPPAAERTRDWALLHLLITQPETSGRAHIYLHNLATGMDANGAIRSMGQDVAKFNADVDRYFAAGQFQAVPAPNRPLNPERDFVTAILTADDGQLARADLMGPGAEAAYVALLKAGKHAAEANEGLGFLALRAGDEDKAGEYFAEACKAGSKNVVALTTYGKWEKHYDVAIDVLKQALTIDPKYAPAHWELGDKLDDPSARLAEWKIALGLAPHNVDWWVSYARLNEGQKHWAEAGRAWTAAAQATSDPAKREEFLSARGRIEQQRLDDEAAEKRREDLAKAAEIDRLKAEARKEIASIEARANSQNPKKNDTAPVLDWWDDANAPTVAGTLTRVDCAGKQLRLTVKEASGTVRVLLVADPSGINVSGGEMKFVCGVQKARAVVIHYKPSSDSAGVLGQVTGIEYK